MTEHLPQSIFTTAPKDVQTFFRLYKLRNGYTNSTVTTHQCLEVLRVLVHNPEFYDSGIKTNVIELESIIFGYEGEDPIYPLFDEASKAIKRAIYLRSLES